MAAPSPEYSSRNGLPWNAARVVLTKPWVTTGIIPDIVDWRLLSNSSTITLSSNGITDDVCYLTVPHLSTFGDFFYGLPGQPVVEVAV